MEKKKKEHYSGTKDHRGPGESDDRSPKKDPDGNYYTSGQENLRVTEFPK